MCYENKLGIYKFIYVVSLHTVCLHLNRGSYKGPIRVK